MYTPAGYLCRCPEARRKGDWSQVTVREQGKGALDEMCERPSMRERECRETYKFNTPFTVRQEFFFCVCVCLLLFLLFF